MKTFIVCFKLESRPNIEVRATKLKVDQGLALFIEDSDPKEIVAVISCDAIWAIAEKGGTTVLIPNEPQ